LGAGPPLPFYRPVLHSPPFTRASLSHSNRVRERRAHAHVKKGVPCWCTVRLHCSGPLGTGKSDGIAHVRLGSLPDGPAPLETGASLEPPRGRSCRSRTIIRRRITSTITNYPVYDLTCLASSLSIASRPCVQYYLRLHCGEYHWNRLCLT
jgi:hypothetical protein